MKFIKGELDILLCETDTIVLFLNVNDVENITTKFTKFFDNPVSSYTISKMYDNIITNIAISNLSIDVTRWSHKLKGGDVKFSIDKTLTRWISKIGLSHDKKSFVFSYRNNLEYYRIED